MVAALIGEPAANEVEALLRDPSDRAAVTAVNLAETLDVLVRHQGWPPDEVEEKLRWLTIGGLAVVPVDEVIGLAAGRLHAEHYHRTRRPISLGDCIALAAAQVLETPLATSDPALIATAVETGCPVVALPDARGRRPRRL